MSAQEIKAAIVELPPAEVAEMMNWLTAHHAMLWDKQIAEDLDAGKLDLLLAQVDEECNFLASGGEKSMACRRAAAQTRQQRRKYEQSFSGLYQ